MATDTVQDVRSGTAWGRVVGLALGLSIVVGVLVTAFVWPSSEVAPRDVPIAVAGPPEVVAQAEQQIEAALPGAFDVEQVADVDAARQAIQDREVYGALVLQPSAPPQLMTASAASPAVAQLLTGVATQLADSGGPGVVDVVPLPDGDPRGTGFGAGALPMVMAGLAVGVAMAFVVSAVWRRVAGAVLAAIGGAALAVLVMQTWLEVLSGDWLANAGAFALTVAAASLTIIGMHAVLGRAGIGIAALVMFLLGNPLSGVTSAPEMLPSGWGAFGQALPPGAGGSLLRSTSFFDGAGAGGPLLVLGCWIAGGLLLAALSGVTRSRGATAGP